MTIYLIYYIILGFCHISNGDFIYCTVLCNVGCYTNFTAVGKLSYSV